MFEVKKHLIRLDKNRLYLPVAARLVWFRQEHPDWGIETRAHSIDTERQFAIFEAMVYNAEGRLMAKGTKMETARGFADYIEKAETGAIGRALAVCGFGTQFAPDLDEITAGRIVDAPQMSQSDYAQRRTADTPANSAARDTSMPRTAARPPLEIHDNRADSGRDVAEAASNGAGQSARVASAPPAAPAADRDGAAAELECAGCGRGLTKGQEALSVRKYGIALCPDCQKERRSAEAAG